MFIKLKCPSIGILFLLLTACEGDEGQPGKNSLVNVVAENPGSNCVNGGIKVEYGLDQNRDNVLTSDEVDGHNLICNGRDGEQGLNYLFDAMVVESVGTNCQFGGYKLISGLDSNRNGILDVSEHQNTFYICTANNYVLSSVYENPGENCDAGGYRLQSGIDTNSNGELDVSETLSTQFVCNGSNAITDKITRLEIPGAGANTFSSTPKFTGALIKFNKSDFATDSIVFVTDPFTGGDGNLSIVELYNVTDGVPIAGSLLSTNVPSSNRVFLFSENIFDNLPNKEITIGVKSKSSVDGQYASNSLIGLYLFIYKK
jgi:hypothetical protein